MKMYLLQKNFHWFAIVFCKKGGNRFLSIQYLLNNYGKVMFLKIFWSFVENNKIIRLSRIDLFALNLSR